MQTEDTGNSETRYQEIARYLRDELAAGRYGEEGRMPSEAQLVRKFGVSRPTAARALRSLMESGLIVRRAGSGTYAKPDRYAKGQVGASGSLAMLIPDVGNTDIFQLIGGEIASLARVHNFGMIWGAGVGQNRPDNDLSLKHAEELCQQLIESRVSGVFLAPYELVEEKEEINQRMANMLRDAGISVILLDRDLSSFPHRSEFDVVGIDNVAGGYLVAEHLLKLGCSRLCFISRPLSAPTVEARITGMREALGRRKIDCGCDWIRTGQPDDKAFVLSLLKPPRPDAFVCANDHSAALLLHALRKNAIRVPEDIRVVGFDDAKFAALTSPPLTTMQQPCRDLALTAFRAMLNRMAEPTLPPCHFVVTPRLIVRDSCGAYLPRPAAQSKGPAIVRAASNAGTPKARLVS